MKRHSHSLGISLFFHLLLIVVLFFSYTRVVTQKSLKNIQHEKKICIRLNSLVPPTVNKRVKKSVEKKIKKRVKKKKKIKKKVKKSIKKLKREVVEKVEIKQIEPSKDCKTVEVVEPPKIKEPLVEQIVVMEEEKKRSAEEVYIDENLKKIVSLLQENLYYPRRARKRGTQGDVMVKFKLSKNGVVSSVEVLSSKYEILSRGAIKTIENLSTLFPKPKEDLILSVPISYRLQ